MKATVSKIMEDLSRFFDMDGLKAIYGDAMFFAVLEMTAERVGADNSSVIDAFNQSLIELRDMRESFGEDFDDVLTSMFSAELASGSCIDVAVKAAWGLLKEDKPEEMQVCIFDPAEATV